MRWVKHAVRLGRLEISTKVWSGKLTGKGELREQNMAGRTVRTWSINMDIKEVECMGVDWINVS